MPDYAPDSTITERDRAILKAIAAWQFGDGIEFRSIDGNWPTTAQSSRGPLNYVPLWLALVEMPRSLAVRIPFWDIRILELRQMEFLDAHWDILRVIPQLNGRPVDSIYTLPSGSAYAVRFVDDQAYIVAASKRRHRLAIDSPDVLGWWRWSDVMYMVTVTAKGLNLLQIVPATTDVEMPHLTAAQLAIVRIMPMDRLLLSQEKIAQLVQQSREAVKPHLAELERKGVIHRPEGDRRGYALTKLGRCIRSEAVGTPTVKTP